MSTRISKLTAAVSFAFLAACATQKAAEKKDEKKAAQAEKIALSNVSQFDIAACSARPLDLPAITPESIIGVLLVGQPSFVECLVDTKTRGPVAETRVTVKVTVSDAEVKYDVSGDNLLPDGKACIEAAAKKLPLKPLDKGTAPVSSQFGFAHQAGPSPSVRFGINLASDIVGTIRLAQLSWCDCYSELGTTPPPSIKASLKLMPPGKDPDAAKAGQTVEVKLEPGTDPVAVKLAACLEPKLKAVQFPAVVSELKVPYPFLLINSSAAAETTDAPPAFQFLQLESIRGQRNADVAIQLGGRGHSAAAYDAVVTKYRQTKQFALVKELKEKCAAVLASDDKWIGSLKALLETDQHVLGLVGSLKAKDPQWVPVEAEGQKRVATVQGDIATAEKQKVIDVGACPKERK